MTTIKNRIEAAERMIDAILEDKVTVGKKAKDFLSEYRAAYPKEGTNSTSGNPSTVAPRSAND